MRIRKSVLFETRPFSPALFSSHIDWENPTDVRDGGRDLVLNAPDPSWCAFDSAIPIEPLAAGIVGRLTSQFATAPVKLDTVQTIGCANHTPRRLQRSGKCAPYRPGPNEFPIRSLSNNLRHAPQLPRLHRIRPARNQRHSIIRRNLTPVCYRRPTGQPHSRSLRPAPAGDYWLHHWRSGTTPRLRKTTTAGCKDCLASPSL
jgi:hypothetical protein